MRTLTGITPSGTLHIGNYFGAMRPAIEAQAAGDCFYFIANYHSMTSVTDAAERRKNTLGIALDWLACGLDPQKSVFWRQSDVPEVTELTWLIGSLTPMGLLERAHSYKDKTAKGLSPNFGLFAYPVLMAADILLYDTHRVPVGKDQKQHLEMTRDIAIKFNEAYGETLVVPEPIIGEAIAIIPGLDGQKMSKSYNNTISLREPPDSITKKIRTMPTDPARVRRTDKGEPERCPVWPLHQLYSDATTRDWVQTGCRSAGIGCLECKQPLIDAIVRDLAPMRERAQRYIEDPTLVRNIVADGCERARELANETMRDVREAMGLAHS
jgi:tryptophanyl-tRNA synthetase